MSDTVAVNRRALQELVQLAYAWAEKIDGEWGCCRSVAELRAEGDVNIAIIDAVAPALDPAQTQEAPSAR